MTDVARTVHRTTSETAVAEPARVPVTGPQDVAPAPSAPGTGRSPGAMVRTLPTEFHGNRAARPEPVSTRAPLPGDEPVDPAPEDVQEDAAEEVVARPPGKRELRRQETRARIVDAAAELFAERGFDRVSVMEIARHASVVEKTVFNHFPVKEGLVFDADPPMRAALLETVRRRPAGESVAAAAGTFVVSAMSMLGAPEAADGVGRMARIVRGSRTLQVREREIIADLTDALAELIAEETDARSGQLEPWLTAHAVLGLYAGLLELARDRVLDGVRGAPLAAELRRRGQRGLSLLQFGLAGYAKRR